MRSLRAVVSVCEMLTFGNHYRTDSQSVGEEYKLLLVVIIKVDDST